MEKHKNNDYYIGLDIGTSSVGWAVTTPTYTIRRFHKKSMIGVRLFDEANTAADRRTFRTNRRRLARRSERLSILRSLFEKAMQAVDPTFFTRLNESKLHLQDKKVQMKYPLFGEEQSEKSYYEQFPTIYHLRNHLMSTTEPQDIRIVYLAISHILKYRGHFLFAGTFEKENNFSMIIDGINDSVYNFFEIQDFVNPSEIDTLESKIVLNQTKTEKKKDLEDYLLSRSQQAKENKDRIKAMIGLMVGSKVDAKKLFTLDIEDKVSVEFSSANFDEAWDDLSKQFDADQRLFIERFKALYDYATLSSILNSHKTLSEAKVSHFNKHREDLAKLKAVLKEFTPEKYYEMFHDDSGKVANYVKYINKSKEKVASYEDFKKYCQQVLEKFREDERVQSINYELDRGSFLPKQRTNSNGVIPHQLHEEELKKILENAQHYLPFLNERDDTGLTVREKILQLFKFRIPYYIGPLNPASSFAWVIRKKGKIYPWNFDQLVDREQSAEKFITRMTNNCTYLLDAPVLPKHSIQYSKVTILNLINKIKVSGQPITVEQKQNLFQALFLDQLQNVTKKRVREWLINQGIATKQSVIDGIDDTIPVKMSAYHELKDIIGNKVNNTKLCEEIIRWITLFHDDKDMLKNKLTHEFSDQLTEEQIDQLVKKSYAGWGRFSFELLNHIIDETHFSEPKGILQALWETNDNLMELLSFKYDFAKAIEQWNNQMTTGVEKLTYELVDELYVSPSVKRSIWQTLNIVDEIVTISGCAPKRIFIEVAREHAESKRTVSRKKMLLDLYKNIQAEKDLLGQLENEDDARLRSKKLYLYYTQLGKCMYSGQSIPYNELFNNNLYDKDHIFPQSKTKDDSIDNLVLVSKTKNGKKSDVYPISGSIQQSQFNYWKMLRDKGLISAKKFERLTRKDPLTEDELANFIARQIVETRQSSKAVAELLKKLYPNTEIVYVKARNVSDFRQKFKLIKFRELNDLHHGKDAYLNIVVGNVYHTKFTADPRKYIKLDGVRTYNLKRMYDFDVSRNGSVAWKAGDDGTIKKVRRMMDRNDLLVTRPARMGKGGLFDQTLMPKGKGQIPVKAGSSIEHYGGYNKATVSHFVCVDSLDKKGKHMRSLEAIPVFLNKATKQEVLDYLRTTAKLTEPKIKYGPIPKTNTLISWDGKLGYITGKSGSNIVFKNAVQLLLPHEIELRLKQMDTCMARNEIEKMETTELVELYDVFLNKTQSTVYKRLVFSQINKLIAGRELFINFPKEKQAYVIKQIMKLFLCNRELSDLRDIGGAGQAGSYSLGKNITDLESLEIIHHSVTGLFETRKDLMKL